MKIVKKTKRYIYVALGDRDLEDVFSASDLVRTSREPIDAGYYSVSDAIKCDGDYEEIDYLDEWCVKVGFMEYKFELPKNVDEVVEEQNLAM